MGKTYESLKEIYANKRIDMMAMVLTYIMDKRLEQRKGID